MCIRDSLSLPPRLVWGVGGCCRRGGRARGKSCAARHSTSKPAPPMSLPASDQGWRKLYCRL
eukprot:28343-Rhodomonas_salina.1